MNCQTLAQIADDNGGLKIDTDIPLPGRGSAQGELCIDEGCEHASTEADIIDMEHDLRSPQSDAPVEQPVHAEEPVGEPVEQQPKLTAHQLRQRAKKLQAREIAVQAERRQIGGLCPVQAEGTIDGKPFYFRARGSAWSIGIGGEPVGSPEWSHREPYGDGQFDAGWMRLHEARAFIEQAAQRYHDGEKGAG